ncbi:MAG: S46 family peptidase [Bacteroidales bacterium]|nr:S46 family peptidase [Bacteroidales bacterium]
MFKKLLIVVITFSLFLPLVLRADEGMWLPLLLKKREADMQKKGMKISAQDIYDVNNSSLKDAVMLFGGGCTGEFVSNEGLLLTNHHCGYSHIVRQSTVERDYLTNGFWAYNKQEELPCEGLSITLLVYMEDVTGKVLKGVTNTLSEKERKEIIKENTKVVIAEAIKDSHYKAEIKPFYYGNQYFLYVNEVFTDIRLVGAPPSNIGKFGGDSDNWMWPRHTGDFSMFRVYANKDNKPADYSKDNIPFTPKKFLKINLKGLNEGDFTFVFGYPGTTEQFLTSHAVDRIANYEDPARIKLRNLRLNVYNNAMNQSPDQRLRYAAGVAGIANGWKKWMGEVKGLKRMNAVERKRDFENKFNQWANIIPERKDTYGGLINNFEKLYFEKSNLEMSYIYLVEAVLASDLMKNGRSILGLIDKVESNKLSKDAIQKEADNVFEKLNLYFSNDYSKHKLVDKTIFVDVMSIYYEDFAQTNSPWIKEKVDNSFKGNARDYFDYIYENSFLSSPEASKKKLKKFKVKNVLSDPAVELLSGIWGSVIGKDIPNLNKIDLQIDSLYRSYVVGIMEMNSGKDFYPDANLSLRVAYGNIKPYKPRDGVDYSTHTTIKGIMEKENPDIYDYVVEKKLKELYKTKDYGRYANSQGEVSVAFIASNHTTGGNSGSPVLDANGNLVGINFDRNWEGTMSDIMYDPDQCRNISIDIRYCLFIIDKFAGAKNLIEELTIAE